MTGSGRPTLAAIAAETGVSAPTVSKVLNGRFDVARATRARVEAALVHHGYTLGRAAATTMIDLMIHDVRSAWADAMVRGTVDAAAEIGLDVVVSTSKARRTRADWLENTLHRGTNGLVVVVDPLQPGDGARLADCGVPVVLVDPLGQPTDGIPSVGVANWQGGLLATEHLLRLGHRRIAVIGGPAEYWSTRARIDGYRAALTAAGVPADPGLVQYGNFSEEAGRRHALTLLNLPEPPTAIFCGNDEQAVGALHAIRERGFRVPEQISLVGFDDIPLARWLTPTLTTVRQPLEEMAAEAVHLLGRQLDGGAIGTVRRELGVELVVRQSTAPPAVDPDP